MKSSSANLQPTIGRVAVALLAALLICTSNQSARAGFALIDDFQSYAVGTPIHGQGSWQAEAQTSAVAAGVSVDPLNSGNQVLNIGSGGFTSGTLGHRETINTDPGVRMNQGTTATLFFRLAWDTAQVDMSIGMSDVANPISDTIFNSFTQFESQLAVSFTPGADKLAMRDGGTSRTVTTDVAPLTWYNVWMIINNSTDTTQLFVQGGAFADQTQLSSAGISSFLFRNGVANNDLLTFFIATGRNTSNLPPSPTENIGPVYVDDLYVDQFGANLINPVPEPGTCTLGAFALAALVVILARNSRVAKSWPRGI